MPNGIFHDAHEVYGRDIAYEISEWQWVATFATKKLANNYVTYNQTAERQTGHTTAQWEVRPI